MNRHILKTLENIERDLSTLVKLSEATLTAITKATEKNRVRSAKLFGPLRDPEVRNFIFQSRQKGHGFKEIERLLEERFPNDPSKHVPRNTIWRFIKRVREGRLAEFGINLPKE